MGNSKSSELEQYDSKPSQTQLEQAIETLRAYRLYARSNNKYSTAIGKFLNEIDGLKKKVPNSIPIGRWLKNKYIYDPNIEYMFKLQDVTHSEYLRNYKQHQLDELYEFCIIKSGRNRGVQYTITMKTKMHKLLKLINEISVNAIELKNHKTETKLQIKNNATPKPKKKAKLNRRKKMKKKKKPKKSEMSKSSAIKPFEDASMAETNKQFSYKETLVSGYIRNIGEKLLSDIIIPIDVCHLCLKYYSHNEIFLVYIPIDNNTPICVKVRNNFYSKHNMKIFELNSTRQDSTELTDNKWMIQGSSLHFKQNIKLPELVTSKLSKAYNKVYRYGSNDYYKHSKSDTYSIIFNRGGGHQHANDGHNIWLKKCYAIAFNDRELYKSDTNSIIGFKYSLPNCKRELSSLLYSERYGLIAVGGGISIYNLSFRNKEFYAQNKKEWKWLSFGHLQERRKQFSTVMFDAKRLMVVGGDRVNDPKSELIDLSGHRNKRTIIAECNGARCKAGILYDNYHQRVFIGGGHSMKTKAVDEFYDVVKGQWYIYAERQNYAYYNMSEYEHWPVLYSNDKEIIYITNSKSDFGRIDLRENTKQWTMYNPNISFKHLLKFHRCVVS